MFPDARMSDQEMFSHLDLSFDMTSDQVTIETAAKDYHGQPHYQYIYDTDYKTAIEVTNFGEDEWPKETDYAQPAVAPIKDAPAAAQVVPVPVAVASPVPQNAATNAVTNPGQAEVDRVLTPEE